VNLVEGKCLSVYACCASSCQSDSHHCFFHFASRSYIFDGTSFYFVQICLLCRGSNKTLSLSLKRHQCHSVVDMFKVCCADSFWFSSQFGDFYLGSSSCTSFQTFLSRLQFRFILYIWAQL